MGCTVAKPNAPVTTTTSSQSLPNHVPQKLATSNRNSGFSILVGPNEPSLPPQMPVYQLVLGAIDKWCSQSSPQREFMFEFSTNMRYTYNDLRAAIELVSGRLLASGFLSGDPQVKTRIAMCLPDSFSSLALFLALICTPGATVVPLSPAFGVSDFLMSWKLTQFKLVFLMVRVPKCSQK